MKSAVAGLALASLLFLTPPADAAGSFSRDSMAHRLPSIISWRERKSASWWGEVNFLYSPHFLVMSGDDPDTLAAIGSKLSHKVGIGIKKNLGESAQLGLAYNFDVLGFIPNQGAAQLTETNILLQEYYLIFDYYFDHFAFFATAGQRDRPYYTRLGSNIYDLNRDTHLNFTGGLKYLAYQNDDLIIGAGGLYSYYGAGSKALIGNDNISAFQVSAEATWQTRKYIPERTRMGIELYYRHEFAKAVSAERELKDIGLTLKYDICF